MALTHRRSPAIIAESNTRRQRRQDARNRLPAMDAYLLINNPNANQQRDQITLLTNAALATVRGAIGG